MEDLIVVFCVMALFFEILFLVLGLVFIYKRIDLNSKILLGEFELRFKQEVSDKLDKLNTINDKLNLIQQLQRKMTELVCYRIRKLELKSDEMKTGIDSVADNVNNISVSQNIVEETETEASNDERFVTYEEMIRDYQADRQIDYRHQVSRLQRQVEVLEEQYENVNKENKKLKDDIIKLKSELELEKVLNNMHLNELDRIKPDLLDQTIITEEPFNSNHYETVMYATESPDAETVVTQDIDATVLSERLKAETSVSDDKKQEV